MGERTFQIKNGGTLKTLDADKRTICGYYASFNTLDSDGDVFQPGCFAKSLKENKDRILHLLQHDTTLPICRPTVLIEDSKGLYFESYFPAPGDGVPDYIEETFEFYKSGVYNEHSVGFEMLQNEPDREGKYPEWAPPWNPDNKRAANIITQAKLWEGSTVTWGANKNTPFVGIKGATMEDLTRHLKAKELVLKNRKGSDKNIELFLKELEELSKLTAIRPGTTIEPDAKEKFLESLNNLQKSIK